jgi:hypothetical protein
MPFWPEHIDPRRAGLSTAELLQLVHQPHHDADDSALLETAGFTVVPASQADASDIPAKQRTPRHGVVVVNDAPGLRINPVLWQELKGAEDEAAEAAAALRKLGPHLPVPFWLAFLPPTPRAVLMADLNDEEPGEILPLPEVDQIDQWPDVDPELVAEAATSSLVLTMGSWTHPLTYRRGSRKRDLVARPLRTVHEWLAIYPALVSEPLGGDWRDPSEWQQCMGPDVIPFWEVLDLPAELSDPVPGETDTAVCMDTTTRLVGAGWFAAHGLDEHVDRAALSFHGYRTLAAWQDSDFAPLLRPRSPDRASPPPGRGLSE